MAEHKTQEKQAMQQQDQDKQSYMENLVKTLNKFRKEDSYCDVILVVGETKFHAHKNILSAASPYFGNLFNQTKKKRKEKAPTVMVNDMPVAIMDALLDYLYTGQVSFTAGNVEGLIKAANVLVLPGLKLVCCRYLEESLDLENCMYLFAFGDANDCGTLKQAAQYFISQNFQGACKTNSFLELEVKQVEELICNDDIIVEREEKVYEAVLRWVKHDITARSRCFTALFRHVRLSFVSKYYLHTNIAGEELVKADRTCIEMLLETMKQLSLAEQPGASVALSPRRPRLCLQTQTSGIIVCGGLYAAPEGTPQSSCLFYVPFKHAWYNLAPMEAPETAYRWAHSMVELEGFLYVAGGFCDDTRQDATSLVSRYDLRTNTWAMVSELPRCTALPAAAALGGKVYTIGGTDNHALKEVQMYTPSSDTWQLVAPLTTARCAPCAAANHQGVYVFGGMQEAGEFLRTAERYDHSNNSWSVITAMSTERAFACAVVMETKIYVIGGSTDVHGNQALASTEVYDTGTDDWALVSNMSVGRFAASAAVLADMVYVLGGGQGSQSHASLECYSAAEDKWTVLGDMPRGIAHAQCCTATVPTDILGAHGLTIRNSASSLG